MATVSPQAGFRRLPSDAKENKGEFKRSSSAAAPEDLPGEGGEDVAVMGSELDEAAALAKAKRKEYKRKQLEHLRQVSLCPDTVPSHLPHLSYLHTPPALHPAPVYCCFV